MLLMASLMLVQPHPHLDNYDPLPNTPQPPAVEVEVSAPVVQTSYWDAVAECESSGRWDLNEGLFDGGLQFLPSTWDAFKPDGFPDYAYQATREQQIAVAELTQAGSASDPWPNCP